MHVPRTCIQGLFVFEISRARNDVVENVWSKMSEFRAKNGSYNHND